MNTTMKAAKLTIAKKSAMSPTLPVPASTGRERGGVGCQQIVNGRCASDGSTGDHVPKVTSVAI
jgi:hypothetical protein